MNAKKSLIIFIFCGALVVLTGIAAHIISGDLFSVFIMLAGVAVIVGGIVHYFATRGRTENTSELTEYYIELYSGFAASIGRQKIFKRKLGKLKKEIFKVCLSGDDIETKAFALYIYFVYGMDRLFKKHNRDTVIDCLSDIFKRGNAEETIESLPEGMTLCDLVARDLKMRDNFKESL